MIDILHHYTKAIIYHSETAQTIAEAVVEAIRSDSDLSYSDLRGSNLSGSNLSGSNLRDSDLSGSNLRDSDLRDSDLRDSDLRGSDLRGSDLSGSDLSGSNLRGSNLRDSDLRDSDLSGSDLSGSDLSGSDLSGSDLSGSNLRGSNLPEKFYIAMLCFGGWPVTATPSHTQIGCERHPNASWLAWTTDAPEIAAMHTDATAWWVQHRKAVCAVIRDVMASAAHAASTREQP